MTPSAPTIDLPTTNPESLAAIDLVHGSATALGRWIDRLNPIFIKETRQAIKSKQFVIAFLLMLLISWLISVIAIAAAGQRLDFGNWGRDLFSCYFVVLSGAILIIVPFTAFRSLSLERDDATYEPLVMSTLTPRQIILGKLQSAMLQVFLYYSAIAPFMAFTALLQGFDIKHVALLLVSGAFAALWCTVAALAVCAVMTRRRTQTLVSLAVLGGLFLVFVNAWAWSFNTQWLNWNDLAVQLGAAVWIVGGIASIILLQQVAVINLTFPADNRSTALRLIVQGLFVLIWLALWLMLRVVPTPPHNGESYLVGLSFSLVLWALAGLFFVTESDHISRRIRRELPRRPVVRLASWPFLPGGQRGLVLVLLNLVILGGVIFYAARRHGWTMQEFKLPLSLTALLYFLIYVNLAAAMTRWGMRATHAIQPMHGRVATVVLIAVTMSVPMFLMTFSDDYLYNSWQDFRLFYLISPIVTFEHLALTLSYAKQIVIWLSVLALLSTALNVPAMIRGLFDLWDDRSLVEEHLP
ncbi:MAG: ABC transporter permease [Planctomycetaceae bacterium]